MKEMSQKRRKMDCTAVLSAFMPSEIVEKVLDYADYHRFETMEYWKEIAKQPKVERFPMGKLAEVGWWEGWIDGSKYQSTYSIGLCHCCTSPCSIYNQKIYIDIGYKVSDYCSQKCAMEGESFDYARYEKMHYKYAYD